MSHTSAVCVTHFPMALRPPDVRRADSGKFAVSRQRAAVTGAGHDTTACRRDADREPGYDRALDEHAAPWRDHLRQGRQGHDRQRVRREDTGHPPGRAGGQNMLEICAGDLRQKQKTAWPVTCRNLAICRALRTGEPVHECAILHLWSADRIGRSLSAPYQLRNAAGKVTGCLSTMQGRHRDGVDRPARSPGAEGASVDDLIEESLDMIMNAMSLRLVSLYLWDGSAVEAQGTERGTCRHAGTRSAGTCPTTKTRRCRAGRS